MGLERIARLDGQPVENEYLRLRPDDPSKGDRLVDGGDEEDAAARVPQGGRHPIDPDAVGVRLDQGGAPGRRDLSFNSR